MPRFTIHRSLRVPGSTTFDAADPRKSGESQHPATRLSAARLFSRWVGPGTSSIRWISGVCGAVGGGAPGLLVDFSRAVEFESGRAYSTSGKVVSKPHVPLRAVFWDVLSATAVLKNSDKYHRYARMDHSPPRQPNKQLSLPDQRTRGFPRNGVARVCAGSSVTKRG